MGTRKLRTPLTVNNVDGSPNRNGTITDFCNLWVRRGPRIEKFGFYVANLGRDRLILGYPWFKTFNPSFDWTHNTLVGDPIVINTASFKPQFPRLCAVTTTEQDIETEHIEVQKTIPPHYHGHWKVFSEHASNQFPPEREEDHAILLKDGAPSTIDCRRLPPD